jgi:hypothetical protein
MVELALCSTSEPRAVHLTLKLQSNVPIRLPSLWSPYGALTEKMYWYQDFFSLFPSGRSLNKYGAVIGISLPAWDFYGGLRFILTFSGLESDEKSVWMHLP